MLYLDADFEMKKKFRDAVKILIYRNKKDKSAENLKQFFEDFYQVVLTENKNEINEKYDIINVLAEESGEIESQAAKMLWIESDETKVVSGKFYGKMKEAYRRLFMDQCSA